MACSASSADQGERAVRFLNNLTHTGDFSGEPFDLRPWQADPIRRLFGTLRPDGTRRYRKTFWALPRKQGKTEVVAGGGLYLLMGQGRRNQRIYTGSGDKEQAGLIFAAACEMIGNDPELAARTLIYSSEKRIEYPEGNSKLTVLSSVPKNKHGLGPTAVLLDEYHVIDEELVNVLTTGFGARKDPLTWMITTAGWDRHSLCYDEWQYALKVRDGVIDDPTYLPVIYAADPGDDWTAEATWRKAMPALGDFCNLQTIREECEKAQARPRFENTFKQLYLNLWTEQAVRWLSMDRWAECGGDVDPDDLEGRRCYGGLDLAQTYDLTAFVLIFPDGEGGYDVLCRFWAPEDGPWRQDPRTRELYSMWARQGHLTLTPGDSTDYGFVEHEIVSLAERHEMSNLFADRAFASMLATRLQDDHGLPVAFLPQSFLALNGPTLEAERLVLARQIRHGDNPVLTWCASNVAIRKNASGLVMLDKAKSTGRIDGMAALVNAIAAATAGGESASAEPSTYEDNDLFLL